MMPPTSIDGTDITGATIDGTDVQEITVDGQTVFSAETLPVAYSDLIAWYPFDSATYGGSNADDVTAIIGGSGDDTAYDGTVSGATYQSSGGVTDINAGANSGGFEFDGNDNIDCGSPLNSTQPFTVTAWAFSNSDPDAFRLILNTNDFDNGFRIFSNSDDELGFSTEDNGNRDDVIINLPPIGQWVHYAAVFTGTENQLYIDAQLAGTVSSNGSGSDPLNFGIGGNPNVNINFDGVLDDIRIYNSSLLATEINQIYQNTKP